MKDWIIGSLSMIIFFVFLYLFIIWVF